MKRNLKKTHAPHCYQRYFEQILKKVEQDNLAYVKQMGISYKICKNHVIADFPEEYIKQCDDWTNFMVQDLCEILNLSYPRGILTHCTC